VRTKVEYEASDVNVKGNALHSAISMGIIFGMLSLTGSKDKAAKEGKEQSEVLDRPSPRPLPQP
jgi:hypothetical protein